MRPHEAFANETPGSVYVPSKVEYKGSLAEVKYSHCEKVMLVRENGKFNLKPKKGYAYLHFACGQPIDLHEVEEEIWRLQFLDIILGHYDAKEEKFAPMKELVRLLKCDPCPITKCYLSP